MDIEQKLSELQEKSVWYFAKQETNFDKVFFVMKVLDDSHAWGSDVTSICNNNEQLIKEGLTNHRILSNAQLYGLLTKKIPYSKDQYKDQVPTPVFFALKKFNVDSKEYKALKTEQLLKVRFRALTDTVENNVYTDKFGNKKNYAVYPFLFTLSVLWKLFQKGIKEISRHKFLIFVATSRTMKEVEDVVSWLADDKELSQEQIQLANKYDGDSRALKAILSNFHLIETNNGNTISLVEDFKDYYSYFFDGPYKAIINLLNIVSEDDSLYQKILTQQIGLDINFDLRRPPKVSIQDNQQVIITTHEDYENNCIFYGAPGTSKSHTIKELTKHQLVIRTTFHPDSDYSSFVGSYKPTTCTCNSLNRNGDSSEEKITYKFVPQAFLQAYVEAWKKQASISEKLFDEDKVYLIIEEINRGNCAQIFGDLFQLLDRGEQGFSEYAVKTDADMQKQLSKEFEGVTISQKEGINSLFDEKDVVDNVLKGEILLLPNNLYIWATMNTSDQSLFPIDSAFKRRWDWKYMPISDEHKNWTIQIGSYTYDWWSFLEKINEKIGETTNSEDKKLGYYFCKANNNVISAKTFVGKVIFYIWNDVFKDYDFDDEIFNDKDGGKLTFDKFYSSNGNKSDVIVEKVILFLDNLKLKPINELQNPDENNLPQIGNTESTEPLNVTE